MHNVLFVLIWPLALVCPFLPRRSVATGLLIFIACQAAVWFSTISAMSSPAWDDSAGDMLIPVVILLPSALFGCLLIVRGLYMSASYAIDKLAGSSEDAT